MAVEITKPNVLVVEGREEVFFFGALINHLGLQNIQIVEMEGKTRLKDRLEALTSLSGFTDVISLGVVRDANANPGAASQSVHDALQAANLPAPERPLVPTGHSPRVTVMILPEEGTPGMLEDLCLRAMAPDPAMLCVEQYLQCLQQHGLSLPHNTSKAKVQAFLASRPEAGKRLGEAAQAGYWPWDDATFEQVKNFLQQISSGG
jgi:hypothetical protein